MANLSLLSEFSKAAIEVADWWSSVKDDLAVEEPTLLAVTYPQYEGWSEMKDDFQEYYDVVRRVSVIAIIFFINMQPSRSILYISDSLNYFHHQSQLGNQWLPHLLALQGTRKTLTSRQINPFSPNPMSVVRMDTSNLHVWEVLNWDGSA